MLDHVTLSVADFDVAKAFYKTALAPLGVAVLAESGPERGGGAGFAGFGAGGRAFFWIGSGKTPTGGAHVAFVAASRAEVDAFHAAALAVGARDNGPPGLRPRYHRDYYGAFVLDPEGNNIEAVCRKPE
jgi:catechol 2,3-dioxygenase-like lactoylglutathione lyase family enzyme